MSHRVDIEIETEHMINQFDTVRFAFNILVAGWVVYQSPFMFSEEQYALEDGELFLRDRMIELMGLNADYLTVRQFKEEMYGDGR